MGGTAPRSPSPRHGSGSSTAWSRGARTTTCRSPFAWRGSSRRRCWRRCWARCCAGTRCCARPSRSGEESPSRSSHRRGAGRCRSPTSAACRRAQGRRRRYGSPGKGRRGRSTSGGGRCSAPCCCGSGPPCTPCCSRCTTSSPTSGRPACWCGRSRRSMRPPSPARRRGCRSSRSSTPISPHGSAASRERSSSGSSPTGGGSWPPCRPRSTCRPTGRSLRRARTGGRGCASPSPPAPVERWRCSHGGTRRRRSWSCSPPSRRCWRG